MIRNKKTFYVIYVLAFFISMAYALPLYIQSSYLEQFTSIKYVGLFVTIATSFTLLAIFNFSQFIQKYTNYRVMVAVLIAHIIGTVSLVYSSNQLSVLLFFVIHFVTITLLGINLDVFLEDISDHKNAGRTRTTYLTIVNFAILISPLLMGKIVNTSGQYKTIYFISAIILILAGIILLIFRKNLNDHIKYKRRHIVELVEVFKKNKNLLKIFLVSFILRFFFGIMVFYTPIYLNQYLNFPWTTIGIIFTIMLIPFVVFEIPAGRIADKYIGEKEFMVLGLVIMSVFTGMIFFISTKSVILWALILFMTRVGASLLEAMHEVYFFKIVKREDVDIINLFRDTHPAGWLMGSIISVVILKFFPIQYIFLFLAITILFALYPALTLKDTK